MGLAIITGASHGLGAALSDTYRERGWAVLEFSRTQSRWGGVELDLSDIHDAAEVFADAFASLAARPAAEVVAFSNAAMLGPVGPVENASTDQIAEHFDVNVVSAILFARAFVSAFQGHDCLKTFVNVTSGAAAKGHSGWSLYCASKAAMENYVRAVALEQAARAHPIRAISVNPGVMDTAMQAQVRASRVEDFPERERFVRLKLEGRLAQPAHVASRIAAVVDARPEPGEVY